MNEFQSFLSSMAHNIIGGAVAGGAILLRQAFLIRRDLPVCHARVLRDGRGLPWNRQIMVHPTKNGKIEITLL